MLPICTLITAEYNNVWGHVCTRVLCRIAAYVLFGHEFSIYCCGVEQLGWIDILKLHFFCCCDAEPELVHKLGG